MTETFLGCSYSELWASPRNWETTTAKSALDKDWYVQCYFFDPRFQHRYPKGFPFRKRINKVKGLDNRKAVIKQLFKDLPELLEQGYNPITDTMMVPEQLPGKPVPVYNCETGLNDAIDLGVQLCGYQGDTAKDVKSIVKYFKEASCAIGYNAMAIGDFMGLHLKQILERVRVIGPDSKERPLTDKRYNKYMAYISAMLTELKENGVIKSNPIDGARKKKVVVETRETLTTAERIKIDTHLKFNHPEFWLFTNVFFHSGGREVELLRLKFEHIDLDNLIYRTLVEKGNNPQWITRPIKEISVHFWEKAMLGAKKGDYIFSIGLKPGADMIRRDQITRRWRTHVKQKLGITADFYSLKHSNLTEISARTSAKEAARAAGHVNDRMVRQHYDVTLKEREMASVQAMTNVFAPVMHHEKKEGFCNVQPFAFGLKTA